MTKHPLTDEICLEITNRPYTVDTRMADMRAAADWQLSQCLNYIRLTYGDEGMVPFMEAMRPQEDNS